MGDLQSRRFVTFPRKRPSIVRITGSSGDMLRLISQRHGLVGGHSQPENRPAILAGHRMIGADYATAFRELQTQLESNFRRARISDVDAVDVIDLHRA